MANLLISYDISNDRLRTRTAKILEQKGCKRVQKSVFFASRFAPAEVQQLRQELRRRISPDLEDSDSILCIPVTQNYLDDVVWEGDKTFFEELLREILVRMM